MRESEVPKAAKGSRNANPLILLNRPREAAVEIVHLINARNQNIALLALAVG